jgi:hypothetical protein
MKAHNLPQRALADMFGTTASILATTIKKDSWSPYKENRGSFSAEAREQIKEGANEIRGHLAVEEDRIRELNKAFQDVANAISNDPIGSGRYPYAFLSDLLMKAKGEHISFIQRPSVSLESDRENVLACMLEDVADLKHSHPPSWVKEIKPTSYPIFPEGVGDKMRLYLLAYGEPIYKRRNIFFSHRVNSRV